MAYDYDVDILAALWTGGEDAKEPYASFIAANPTLTDEVSENRILSTIELLRSHMELLQTRAEANLLHSSISKLFRHTAGGSNPWSDAAAVTDAVGNVPGPTFPAGASIDITIDGVTVSATSATGGDCATVAAEMNVTLDATIPSVAEQTTVDTTGATSPGLSGTSFNINSAGDATPYYVWFNFSGDFEVTSVVAITDVGGALGGTYFVFDSANDATPYYAWMSHPGLGESISLDFTAITGATLPTGAVAAAWFDVTSTTATYRFWFSDGSTTAPVAAGATLVPIAFIGGDTDSTLTAKILPIVAGADANFAGFTSPTATTITGTLAAVGNVTDPADGAVSTGATIATTTQGVAAAVDPGAVGTAIPIIYAVGDADSVIGAAMRSIIGALGDFATSGAGATAIITNAAVGATTDAADAGFTGFTITVTTQGADVSVDPALGGRTGIPVAVSAGNADSEIGSAIRVAVGGNADFTAGGAGNSSELNAVATGVTTDSADTDSGLGVSTTIQGVDGSADAVAVQAFCALPGPRLGFRGQEDFVTFDLANGGGGVIGPAGIIPGERKSSVKKVADRGRDLALGNFAGTIRSNPLTP